jgi:hypothetical protein
MNKTSIMIIIALVVFGTLVSFNASFAEQHNLVFYGRGVTDQESKFPVESIRTIINYNTAVIIHPSTKGIEVVRMNIRPSDVCVQYNPTICLDGIVSEAKNTDAHNVGDKISITIDLKGKREVISFTSGVMRGESIAINFSQTIMRLDGPLEIVLTQEGGIAGVQKAVTIDLSSAQLAKDGSMIPLDDDSVNKIVNTIKKIKFFDIDDESYPPIKGSADYFTYSIKITQNVFQKTISLTDTSKDVPKTLTELKDVLMQVSHDASSKPSVDTKQVTLAKTFVTTAPTFAFDGIGDSLKVNDVKVLESYPEQFVITISFDSLHGGYGDRSEQVMTQAISSHVIVVTVVDGKVISAIIDDTWDELNQKTKK